MKYKCEEGYGAGFLLENYMKYNIKDSVFRMLFSMPKYRLELYKVLLREEDATEEEIEDSTLKNFLVNGKHNDIAIRKDDEFLILTEAQDTWSLNILLRMLFYSTEILERISHKEKKDLFRSKKAIIPEPVFYVIYTGPNKELKGEYSLADEFFPKKRKLDLRVIVINKGSCKGDIVDQYIDFTKEVHNIIDEKGIGNITNDDTLALVERCIRKGTLAEFLTERLEEVMTLMHKIFNEDNYLNGIKYDAYQEGEAKGKKEGHIEERIAMAREFLKAGTPIEVISKVTGFKPSYISTLA